MAVNAVSNKDKMIASSAVNSLKDLAVSYLPLKIANAGPFYQVSHTLSDDPDFVAMAPESLLDLEKSRTWVEWKVLRQLQAIYSEALLELPDINYLVAIDTRYVGEAALQVPADRLAVGGLCTRGLHAGVIQGVRVRGALRVRRINPERARVRAVGVSRQPRARRVPIEGDLV